MTLAGKGSNVVKFPGPPHFREHMYVASPNPRVQGCVRCDRPLCHPIHMKRQAA